MPYNNAYNRDIANHLNTINERFATLYAYSPVDGRGGYSGGAAGVLFQTASASKRDGEDNMYNNQMHLPNVYSYGNDSEGMAGGNAFAEGTFRDTGFGESLGAGKATGEFDKDNIVGYGNGVIGAGMEGGTFWDTLGDIGNTALKFAPLLLALGKPTGGSHAEDIGKAFKETMEGAGLSGGNFWNDFIKGIGDVADVAGKIVPVAMKVFGKGDVGEAQITPSGGKKRGRPKGSGLKEDIKKATKFGADIITEMKTNPTEAKKKLEKIINTNVGDILSMKKGGAILGNPDGYPRQGNSQRLAGRGKTGKNGDLLAMPSPDLANGTPPNAQLRGSYGGAKTKLTKEEKKIIKEAKKMMGKGKKILPGVCRMEASGVSGGKGGRSKRAEIVKEYMKKHGCKMIEASKKVKELGLYKKE